VPKTKAAGTLEQITNIAEKSAVTGVRWKDRGKAPLGYVKGMALVYARVYCKFKANDPAALDMAMANTGDRSKDALTWYEEIFSETGMSNDVAGADTLRHVFVLMFGLGMRESSGRFCEGRDRSASNTSEETAEAGLFQMSFNAKRASPLLPQLFQQYSANSSGFREVFKEGVRCKAKDLENFGSGDGRDYQKLAKSSPAFAAEWAGVGLRHLRRHWGPIKRRQAEVRQECDDMFKQVQDAVDASPDLCKKLL